MVNNRTWRCDVLGEDGVDGLWLTCLEVVGDCDSVPAPRVKEAGPSATNHNTTVGNAVGGDCVYGSCTDQSTSSVPESSEMIRARDTCCYAAHKAYVAVVPSVGVNPGRHPEGDPHLGTSAHR